MELGKGNVIDIAHKAGIRRTTVYDNLHMLKNKQLVGIGVEMGKKYYFAESPTEIKNLIQEQLECSSTLISSLLSIYNSGAQKPKIKFYEAREGYRKFHELSLIANINRRTRYLGDIDTLAQALPEAYIKKYIQQRIKHGICNEVITTQSSASLSKSIYTPEKNRQSLRKIKILAEIGSIKTALFTYDDVVWICPTPGQNYVISIENAEFAETINNIFNVLWKIASDISFR
jgi:sugar-specific transcriptional regulator TrmB